MQSLHKHVKSLLYFLTIMVGFSLLSACAAPNAQQAAECSRMLSIATHELEAAKARGFSSTVSLTKATALISAAKIQEQFNKYPNCIDKAVRARKFIRLAEQENKKH
ncbi:MAG: hypothetical protein P8Z75_01020 [Gammaproteobacteria bacterium]